MLLENSLSQFEAVLVLLDCCIVRTRRFVTKFNVRLNTRSFKPLEKFLSQIAMFSQLQVYLNVTEAKQTISLLLLNNFYPVMSYRRVRKEKKATNYYIRRLWSAGLSYVSFDVSTFSMHEALYKIFLPRTVQTLSSRGTRGSKLGTKYRSATIRKKISQPWNVQLTLQLKDHFFFAFFFLSCKAMRKP